MLYHIGDSANIPFIITINGMKITLSCLTLCDPMDCSLPGSSVHGNSPGQNTGVGCHALLQGIFPTQGSNLGLPHCRRILYHLEPLLYAILPSSALPRQAKKSFSFTAERVWLDLLLNPENHTQGILENYSTHGSKPSEKANVLISLLLHWETDEAS